MTTNLRKLIVSGLGTGYLPIAPGTWASAVPCAIFVLLAWAARGGGAEALVAAGMGMLAVLSSAACVALGPFAEAAYGRKDPSRCVIDEWAGQALALVGLPLS